MFIPDKSTYRLILKNQIEIMNALAVFASNDGYPSTNQLLNDASHTTARHIVEKFSRKD